MDVSLVIPYTHINKLDVMIEKLLASADTRHPIKLVRIIPQGEKDCDSEERLFTELKGLSARFDPYQFEIEIGYDKNEDGVISDDEYERVTTMRVAQGVAA